MINSAGESTKHLKGIKCTKNELITVLDSGSVETLANAEKCFPDHAAKPSKDSKRGWRTL